MGKPNAGSSRFDVVAAAVLSRAVCAAQPRTRPARPAYRAPTPHHTPWPASAARRATSPVQYRDKTLRG
jgi:hypothetical protein